MSTDSEIKSKYYITDHGFLDSCYCSQFPKGWEPLIKLKDNITEDDGVEFRKIVENLDDIEPCLSTIDSLSRKELMYLYSLLSVAQGKYVNQCPDDLKDKLPKQIAKPLLQVSKKLGMTPHFNYYSSFLWNWRFKDESNPKFIGSGELVFPWAGKQGKQLNGFAIVTFSIEGSATKSYVEMIKCKEYMKKQDHQALKNGLKVVHDNIQEIIKFMKLFPDHCDPKCFFDFKYPFDGIVPEKFPNGLAYEGTDADPVFYGNVNAGQGPIFQALDIFLMVGLADIEKKFQLDNRKYYPKEHNEYLEALGTAPFLKDYVKSSKDQDLVQMYDQTVEKLSVWRKTHYFMVKQYIHENFKRLGLDIALLGEGERHPDVFLQGFIKSTEKSVISEGGASSKKKNQESKMSPYLFVAIGIVLIVGLFLKAKLFKQFL